MSCSQQVMKKIDHLLEKNPLISTLHCCHIWLSHDFGQKLEIFSMFVLQQNKP